MTINGTFGRFIKRNEKSGESVFTLHTDVSSEYVICRGVVQCYPRHIPLYLEGEMNADDKGECFTISSIKAKGYSYDETVRFLYGKEFPDIGITGAKNIVAYTGTDIFSYIKECKDIYSAAKDIEGISPRVLTKAFNKIKGYTIMEDLIALLSGYGEGYYPAACLFNTYSEKSLEVLKQNPYVLSYSGSSFQLCEKIAAQNGYEHCDRKRMKAIVERALNIDTGYGNTRTTFHRLCQTVRNIEEEAEKVFTSSPLFIAEEICDESRYHLEEDDGNLYIYKADLYKAEREIAGNIARIV